MCWSSMQMVQGQLDTVWRFSFLLSLTSEKNFVWGIPGILSLLSAQHVGQSRNPDHSLCPPKMWIPAVTLTRLADDRMVKDLTQSHELKSRLVMVLQAKYHTMSAGNVKLLEAKFYSIVKILLLEMSSGQGAIVWSPNQKQGQHNQVDEIRQDLTERQKL